jgi:hypothetical protein
MKNNIALPTTHQRHSFSECTFTPCFFTEQAQDNPGGCGCGKNKIS